MKRLLPFICLLLAAGPVAAETVYIDDQIKVWSRTGPSKAYRVKYQMLPGAKFEVLQRDDETGFVEIQDAAGLNAWIEGEFLTAEPTANVRLVEAQRQIQRMEKAHSDELQSLQKQVRDLTPLKQTNAELQQKLAASESELEQARQKAQMYEGGFDKDAYFTGAVIVLTGMLLGWLFARFGGRRKNSGWSS